MVRPNAVAPPRIGTERRRADGAGRAGAGIPVAGSLLEPRAERPVDRPGVRPAAGLLHDLPDEVVQRERDKKEDTETNLRKLTGILEELS